MFTTHVHTSASQVQVPLGAKHYRIHLLVCMNGWLLPSRSQWFYRVFPDGIVENYPGFASPQDSSSVSSMEVKM